MSIMHVYNSVIVSYSIKNEFSNIVVDIVPQFGVIKRGIPVGSVSMAFPRESRTIPGALKKTSFR